MPASQFLLKTKMAVSLTLITPSHISLSKLIIRHLFTYFLNQNYKRLKTCIALDLHFLINKTMKALPATATTKRNLTPYMYHEMKVSVSKETSQESNLRFLVRKTRLQGGEGNQQLLSVWVWNTQNMVHKMTNWQININQWNHLVSETNK